MEEQGKTQFHISKPWEMPGNETTAAVELWNSMETEMFGSAKL